MTENVKNVSMCLSGLLGSSYKSEKWLPKPYVKDLVPIVHGTIGRLWNLNRWGLVEGYSGMVALLLHLLLHGY
jgi:hypothetical protein